MRNYMQILNSKSLKKILQIFVHKISTNFKYTLTRVQWKVGGERLGLYLAENYISALHHTNNKC